MNNIYDSSETAYINLLYTYNSLMDGGNTNALLSQIEQSWSSDAWTLRNALIAQSPYLSQTVLREVATGNVLPQAMLLEICIANPDATRDESFVEFLQYEIPNALPQYMIDAIVASWEIKTARTTMESTLAFYSHRMATSSDKLLDDLYFRGDLESDSIIPTDTTNYNSIIRYWLIRVQTLIAKYELIENYFLANEFQSSQNLLDSLPLNFNMSSDQVEAYNDYVYYYNFRKNIFNDERKLSELTTNEIDLLTIFTQDGDDFAKGLVRNLLCAYYNICTPENYDLPSENNRMFNQEKINNIKVEANKVSVAPNPAITYAAFSYFLPSISKPAILIISDITGKVIDRIALKDKEGQEIWDTRNINSGMYYYYVKDGNINVAKGKVAVTK